MFSSIPHTFHIFFLVSFLSFQLNAQTTFHSATGYDVSVGICPSNIVVSTTDCPWSYNYNINFYYEVFFTNNPSNFSLNTLQTEIFCNGQSNGYYALPRAGGHGMATSVSNSNVNVSGGTAYNYGTSPNCQNATLANLNCNIVKLKIQGPGIPMQTVDVVCSMTMAPLPLEFESFEAQSEAGANLLTWTVLSEKRNGFFTLYFSQDGKGWEYVADVKSFGDTETAREYNYHDINNEHRIGYYKLVQTDLDGNWNELAIAYVNADYDGFVLSPNPATGNFKVDYQAVNPETTIEILNQQGKPLISRIAQFEGKKDGYFFHEEFNENLTSGVYYVRILSDNQVVRVEKLVIQ